MPKQNLATSKKNFPIYSKDLKEGTENKKTENVEEKPINGSQVKTSEQRRPSKGEDLIKNLNREELKQDLDQENL